jgi:hypothetical protein
MTKFLLRVAAVVVATSFVMASGALASTYDESTVFPRAYEETVEPLEINLGENQQCREDDGSAIASFSQRTSDPDKCGNEYNATIDAYDSSNLTPLATYQDCITTCKAGVVAIEAMCRFIPDPRAKAACFLARFTVPACIGFCGWYFGN